MSYNKVPLGCCLFTEIVYISSAFNAHALGAVAEVAGPGLNSHLGTVIPALLSAMGADEKVCCCNLQSSGLIKNPTFSVFCPYGFG